MKIKKLCLGTKQVNEELLKIYRKGYLPKQ